MPTTLDCARCSGDFFGTPATREVFDSRALLESWIAQALDPAGHLGESARIAGDVADADR
jgi:hypothetical protein